VTSTRADPPTAAPVFFSCISGPDLGKRIALTTTELLVGRDIACNVLSDDPEVGDRFAVLSLVGGHAHVRALSMPLPFVDGHAVTEAMVSPGQQVRLGRSVWQLGAPSGSHTHAGGVREFVNLLGDQLTHAAGVDKPTDWNPREMFGDVTKAHTDDEIEEYFTVGTRHTTPSLPEIDAKWPKPWVFVRVFALSMALYYGFVFAWQTFDNINLIPGLIMIGSVAVPLSLLIFFFEVNVPRNISLYQVLRLALFGGLVSIVVSLFGFRVTGIDTWLGAAGAGIVEEIGKASALLLVVRRPRYRWTLNGLLFGATVGTGFAVFESAGYALTSALGVGDQAMRATILHRGVLSVLGGHVLWTGLAGAALWRVRGDQPFRREMFTDPRFLRVLGMCMVMHMIWNSPIPDTFYAKYLVLGAAAWLLVLGFIQDGLKQVREAQSAVAA
jgi:RsiW-degrading membrane proteinase PrsW (M82 family)